MHEAFKILRIVGCMMFQVYLALIAFMHYNWYGSEVGISLLLFISWWSALFLRILASKWHQLAILIVADSYMLYHGSIAFGITSSFMLDLIEQLQRHQSLYAIGILAIITDWILRASAISKPNRM